MARRISVDSLIRRYPTRNITSTHIAIRETVRRVTGKLPRVFSGRKPSLKKL